MNEHTLQPKLVGIQAELLEMIEADERALELLRKRAQKNRELLNAVNGSLNAFAAKVTGSGKLTDTVRDVVHSLETSRFTPLDVEHALTAKFPTVPLDKNGLRTVLWNMTKRGEIKCTRKGTNRLSAEYERVVSVIGQDAATVRVRRRPVQMSDLLEPSNGAQV